MKKIKIINDNKIGSPFIASFETQEELDLWLSSCLAKNKFGLPERPELDVEGNPTGNILPAEYTIEISDISQEIELQKQSQEALQFLKDTDFKVLRHLRQKALGLPLSLSDEEYLALEQQRHEASKKV
jgi:hypothetical protein